MILKQKALLEIKMNGHHIKIEETIHQKYMKTQNNKQGKSSSAHSTNENIPNIERTPLNDKS